MTNDSHGEPVIYEAQMSLRDYIRNLYMVPRSFLPPHILLIDGWPDRVRYLSPQPNQRRNYYVRFGGPNQDLHVIIPTASVRVVYVSSLNHMWQPMMADPGPRIEDE